MTATATPTTFQRIQTAALETFAEHGFEASGIRQVAERAGIPTSLLYHYSRSKSQLLRVIVEDGLHRLVAADRRAVAQYSSPPDQLAALAAVHVFVHSENPQMARLLDTELRVLDGDDRVKVLELRDQIDSVWAEVLDRGSAPKFFAMADVRVTRLALLRMCNGVATWYSADGRLDVATLAGLFGQLALSACRATASASVDLLAIQRLVRQIHQGMPGPDPGQRLSPERGLERRRT